MTKQIAVRLVAAPVGVLASLVAQLTAPFADHPTWRTMVDGISGLLGSRGGTGRTRHSGSGPTGTSGQGGRTRTDGDDGRHL